MNHEPIGRIATSCLVLLLLAAGARRTQAEPHAEADGEADREAAVWDARPWSLAFHLALAAPAGTVAAEVERSITSHISVAAGAGIAQAGPQWAGLLRLRQVMRSDFALGLGAGVSYGDYENLSIFPEAFERIEGVTWLNAEAFYEARTRSAFLVRVYAGMSQIVNAGRHEREPGASTTLTDHLPYAGVALGVTF
jgi:hypothetical protein